MRGSRKSVFDKRRPLRTALLTQAGLNTEFNNLQYKINHFVEFETKYLGDIPGVLLETDTTNRTEVLKIIDRGKKQGLIPLYVGVEHDAVLYLCKEIIKVNRRVGQEEELMNFPLHEIAQLCYVEEDGRNILAFKHGSPEQLNLAVLYCDNQVMAESICSLVSHCFHLVYTDVMIDLIEDTIDEAIGSENRSVISVATTVPPTHGIAPSEPSSPGTTHSGFSVVSSQPERGLLRDYLWQLNKRLNFEELKTFSSLLKDYNYSVHKLGEFCNKLYELLGPNRRYLMTGMCTFIPKDEQDREFRKFLQEHDVSLPGQGSLNSFHDYHPTVYTRSISEASIHSMTAVSTDADLTRNSEDLATLDAMGRTFERIERSVGETTQTYLPIG